ncbi:hypothetical protein DFS34DRAFT_691225 [Phlyctochytrium arcticum]|nr:hypothetical protein DFS34DRAFT_691225 [Phlyctochytrium arcticum]
MPARLQLPLEIIAQIVEHHLPDYNRLNRQTLVALCLVSRAWRNVAQPHLWEKAARPLRRSAEKQLKAAQKALAISPHLGRFVKTLCIDIDHLDDEHNDLNIVQTVANLCPNLKEVQFFWCPEMGNQHLYELAKNCDKIARLTLVKCPNITADGWIRAAPFLRTLSYLYVYTSGHFGDRAVCAIIDSCSLLKTLILVNTKITCAGVLHIIHNVPELDHLQIASEMLIKPPGIEAIWRQHSTRLDFEADFGDTNIRFLRKKVAQSPNK